MGLTTSPSIQFTDSSIRSSYDVYCHTTLQDFGLVNEEGDCLDGRSLPKGLFSPGFNTKPAEPKENKILISVIEDCPPVLEGILKSLDGLIRSGLIDLGDRQVTVVWATSKQDYETMLRRYQAQNGFTNTSFLNILDVEVNSGTGLDYETPDSQSINLDPTANQRFLTTDLEQIQTRDFGIERPFTIYQTLCNRERILGERDNSLQGRAALAFVPIIEPDEADMSLAAKEIALNWREEFRPVSLKLFGDSEAECKPGNVKRVAIVLNALSKILTSCK